MNQIGKIAIFIDGANLYGCDANAIALPNRSNAQRLDQSLAHNLSRERNRRSPRGLVDRNGTRIEAERKNETAANSGLIRRQYEVISTADEIVHTSVLPRPNKGQGATGRHHRPSFFRSDSPAASPRILSKGHLPSRAATTPDRRANHLRPVTQETDPVRRGQAGTGETTRPRPTTRSPETAWAWCPA